MALKLTDLNPHWIGAGGAGISNADGNPAPERHGVGVVLDCPCGNAGKDHQLFVPFANPLDGGPQVATGKNNGWQRTGDTFETLTLTPSIQRHKVNEHGCEWHGFITAGEVITV